MQENLVIVESPAKAKTIEKFLGKDYVVKSSFGHIRDLAKKGLGIDIANDKTLVLTGDADDAMRGSSLSQQRFQVFLWRSNRSDPKVFYQIIQHIL